MPRIDVWDIPTELPEKQEPLWVGFTRANLADRYDVGKQLGHGGFGSVRVVVERVTGKEYACKSITKRLSLPNVGDTKQNQHLENIQRETLILRRLRGTLNVVFLEDAFEDEEAVHLVMEWCKGGELLQRINTRHYSERTAASYMRAVLRTLAQCHHLRILHRDVKPGNFMLLTDADKAPVKAIDFGLAVFYDPKKLPRKDLGLEGTPHFMAPEQLSGKTEPASDIWSAGVMAYQLLCGFVPFDDYKNPRAPSLSLVWRAILTEEPKFTNRAWEGVSEDAKDFVRLLLAKDPMKRPTAKQALAHPWLQGKSDQRTQGPPLAHTVVQRLQKFGIESALKRTVLDMIANDLINRHIEQLNHLNQQQPQEGANTASSPSQQQENRRSIQNGGVGRRQSEAGEATPEGAAAAAATGSPLPPPPSAAGDGAVSNRLRQLAAQDLLLRGAKSVTKHATVHAGGDALAALRRGQQLMGLPMSRPLPGGGGGGGISPVRSFTSALAALQQQQQQHRSHELVKRPLRRAATSINPGEKSADAEYQEQQKQNEQPGQEQPEQQQEGPTELKAVGRNNADLPPGVPPVQVSSSVSPLISAFATGTTHSSAPALPRMRPLSSLVLPPLSPGHGRQQRRVDSLDSSSSGRGTAGRPQLDAASVGAGRSSAAAGISTYKGPVKDLAAATAWDMSFMKNRLAMEGSGHALQHYAWLLNVGERSLHGVLERSVHAGRNHSPTAEAILGLAAGTAGQQNSQHQQQALDSGIAVAAGGSPAASNMPRRSTTSHLPAQPGAPAAAAMAVGSSGATPNGLRTGSEIVTTGNPDYLRMLTLVARQRAEHRKYQRLSLDTSGHRQTQYEELIAAPAPDGKPHIGDLGEMAPPKEEDEEDAAAGGGDNATASADTTGIFSLTPPSGATSAFATSASLTPPGADLLPSPQRMPQPYLQPALARKSRGVGDGGGNAAPSGSHPPSPHPVVAQPSRASAVSGPASFKLSIPGLEEADALSRCSMSGLGPATAAVGLCRGNSFSKMSHTSSALPAGGEGTANVGEDSVAEWEEGSQAVRVSGSVSALGPSGSEGGKRNSLLQKVRKALMNPVKNLLGSKQAESASLIGDGRQSAAGTGTSTPARGSSVGGSLGLVKLSPSPGAAGGAGAGALTLATVSVSSTATADERGRGRCAYATFLQYGNGTGTTTPQERSGHGGTERSGQDRRERSAHGDNSSNRGNNNDRSSHSDQSGHAGRDPRAAGATPLPGPAGYAIHTVRAHKPQQQQVSASLVPSTAAPAAAERPEPTGEVVLQQQQLAGGMGAGLAAADGRAAAAPPDSTGRGKEACNGDEAKDKDNERGSGVAQQDLAPALGLLLGDPAKVAELQDVMRRLQYDKAEELTYAQLSEGLQWLGYRLEPSEVQDLLRQVTVGANDALTASQFIASQVDWRSFQANHRAEWLDCLRKAFEELGGGPGPDGRVSLDQLMAALHEKLPEQEVNLAVQESLMDAAVEADAVDFDAFVRLIRCNSNDSLASAGSSELSYDLYDPRLKDSSMHGALGDGSHYQPALETVPDDPE